MHTSTIRHYLGVFVALISLLGAAQTSQAATIVYPTGNSVTDAANIQAAVNAGGAVTLKATDNSGTPRAFELDASTLIFLEVDVAISGEIVKNHQTAIHGGEDVFVTDPSGLNVTIQGIHFDGAGDSAVWLFQPHNVTLVGNRITNLPGDTVGIEVELSDGTVEIVENQIGDPAAPAQNPGAWGIHASPVGGSVLIDGNLVAVGPEGLSAPGFGIRISNGPASVALTDNVIHVTNPATSGIRVFNPGGQTTIQGNDVYMDLASIDTSDSFFADIGAIVINNRTDGVYVGQNSVVGTSFCGLCLYGSSHGVMVGNNLSRLVVPAGLSDPDYGVMSAAVLFGFFPGESAVLSSDYNTVVGRVATVFDAGTGNVATGATTVKGDVGSAVSGDQQQP